MNLLLCRYVAEIYTKALNTDVDNLQGYEADSIFSNLLSMQRLSRYVSLQSSVGRPLGVNQVSDKNLLNLCIERRFVSVSFIPAKKHIQIDLLVDEWNVRDDIFVVARSYPGPLLGCPYTS